MSPPIEAPPPTVTDAERQRVMVETLLSLFASDKRLRRWARGTLDDAVYSEIPGDGASRAELAHAITDLCREHRLEREIVDGLAQARPWRATTIRELARTLGISPPKVRWPFGPPRPRPTNPHRVMVVAAMSIAMIVAIAGVLCGVLCNQASQAPTKDGTKPTGQSTTETVIARGSQAFEVEARIERPTCSPKNPYGSRYGRIVPAICGSSRPKATTRTLCFLAATTSSCAARTLFRANFVASSPIGGASSPTRTTGTDLVSAAIQAPR